MLHRRPSRRPPTRSLRTARRQSTSKDAIDDGDNLRQCGNCGFNLDIEREGDSFGGPDERAANYTTVAEPCPTPRPTPGDEQSGTLMNVIMGRRQVIRELDAAGDEKEVYTCRSMNVGGCPLCGSRANQK